MNRLFVLLFGDNAARTRHTEYFLPKVEIKVFNVMIDERKFFDQRIKNSIKTYEKVKTIDTGQGDDYTTGCLLDYFYFKNIIG